MATKKKELSIVELVESHKPKNFKYKFIISDDSIYEELINSGYNIDELDTIQNDGLVQEALQASFTDYPREIVGKAKEPTIMENGVIISKKMVTKADKKLFGISLGFFDYNNLRYVVIKLRYEKFDIIEIFILT